MFLTPLRTLFFFLMLFFSLLAHPVSAATFTVTNNNDAGAGSLRQAILDANMTAGADVITFAANVTGKITLTSGELVITDTVTITGPGANVLAISGNKTTRVFTLTDGTINISGLTVTEGNGIGAIASESGGGILILGPTIPMGLLQVTFTNLTVSGNVATRSGGGIFTNNKNGDFSLLNSTVAGNQATNGGGLYNAEGEVGVVNCTFFGNTAAQLGGGIANPAGAGSIAGGLFLFNSTIVGNTATLRYGGLYNRDFRGMRVQSCIVAQNTAPTSPDLGNITSLGYNLIGNDADSMGFINGVNNDQVGTNAAPLNPMLGSLAYNGGPTQTMALSPNSPALDKGTGNALPTDQRGLARTVNFPSIPNASDGTDVGAFEANFSDFQTLVSDTRAGSVLAFPYYTSSLGGGGGGGNPFTSFSAVLENQNSSDTRITISNISNAAPTSANLSYLHLFLIDGATCQPADFYLCLTPNASFSFKASEYDPGSTGYLIAVAVNNQGVPIQNNVFVGSAFVTTPTLSDNYGAEAFWANSPNVAIINGNTATLQFDNVGYEAVPRQFAVEIQSPLDVAGQQVITVGLNGDLTTAQLTGAAQVGTGQAFNEKEVFASFQGWLNGACQARATIGTNTPRLPNGLGNLLRTGQAGYLKFNVGGAVGLLFTPRGGAWTGIRTLHKLQTTTATLTIPIFLAAC